MHSVYWGVVRSSTIYFSGKLLHQIINLNRVITFNQLYLFIRVFGFNCLRVLETAVRWGESIELLDQVVAVVENKQHNRQQELDWNTHCLLSTTKVSSQYLAIWRRVVFKEDSSERNVEHSRPPQKGFLLRLEGVVWLLVSVVDKM
jgi:hypothetical protein